MVNEVIDGKYEIISKIGSGGTSIVYKARRISDDKTVAVKIIKEGLEDVKEHERHFRLEAEALSQMSHKNIRRILSFGQWNDSLYMVTEYIDGQTLKDIITQNGPIPVKTAVDYALQIVAGIEHAHRKNIIHRDIKPQNVLVSTDGTIKLVDFGIARVLSHDTKTMGGKDVVGSVHYISPEQVTGNEVDLRSDIYSFGILLYEMFTGKVPFQGEEAVSIAMKHINETPAEPIEINPSIPEGINDIILKCIQKKPDCRYQTSSELREDLLFFCADPEHFKVVNITSSFNDLGDEDFEDDGPKRKHKIIDNSDNNFNKINYTQEDRSINVKAKKHKKFFIIACFAALSVIILAVALSIIIPLTEKSATYAIHSVPTVTGLSKAGALAVLRGDQFSKFEFEEETSSIISQGNVVRTEPSEGSMVEVNTVIKVFLSSGPKTVVAKNVTGLNVNEASNIITEQGFTVGFDYVEDSTKENGIVVSQSDLDKELTEGATITLTIVRNTKTLKLTVPNLKGMSADQAKNAIESAGFTMGKCTQNKVDTTDDLGVTWQSINAGIEYPYLEGDEVPSVSIDISVNVCNGYKCTYTYKSEDLSLKNYELIVYDSNGNQVGYEKYVGVNSISYDFSDASNDKITFELYSGSQRIDKKVIQTEKTGN